MDKPLEKDDQHNNGGEAFAVSSRQTEWDKKVEEFSHVADALGEPIDPGIFETVVALNAMGINTRQSCEGHLDENRHDTPWIELQSQNSDELSKKYDEEQSEETFSVLKRENLAEAKKVLIHLEAFYKGRNTPYGKRLVLRPVGAGIVKMEIQETCLEPTYEDLTATNLLSYKRELQDFGEYLKLKFLAS